MRINAATEILIFLAVCIISASNLSGQDIKDPEKEYLRIRDIAFSGHFKEAEASARKLVRSFPDYGDARVLLGRIIAWQSRYPEALAVIDTLLQKNPENADAISAKNDILKWSEKPVTAKTILFAGYSLDHFSEPYKRLWQVITAGAGHNFHWGRGDIMVNTGNATIKDTVAVNTTDLQFEADAYINTSSKNYIYLDYAYSPGTYFPRHRAVAELWQKLPEGWGFTAGGNYYYFDRDIFIASASLEKYQGKYWMSAKGFVYFKDEGPTLSGLIRLRRYLDEVDYLQLTLSAGTAPDEPFDIASDLMRYNAYGLRIAYSKYLSENVSLLATAGYSLEEYYESSWRNRIEGGLMFFFAIRTRDGKNR